MPDGKTSKGLLVCVVNDIKLKEAQDFIVQNDPAPYYLTTYKDAESSYWSEMVDWILESVSKFEEPNILDVGIAYGTLSTMCKLTNDKANIVAVDFMKHISDTLINKLGFDFRFCNFEKEVVEFDKKFDLILLTEVIEHFNFNPVPTIEKLANLLSDNGSIFISTPNAVVWGRLKEYASYKNMPDTKENITIRDQHIYQYSFGEIFEIISNCGLEVVKCNPLDSKNINVQVKKKETK